MYTDYLKIVRLRNINEFFTYFPRHLGNSVNKVLNLSQFDRLSQSFIQYFTQIFAGQVHTYNYLQVASLINFDVCHRIIELPKFLLEMHVVENNFVNCILFKRIPN